MIKNVKNNDDLVACSFDGVSGLPGADDLCRVLMREPDGEVTAEKSNSGVLVLIELDNLAVINERHGKQIGNSALMLLAQSLQGQLCDKEKAFRMNGGVFALLLEGASSRKAATRAQSVAKRMNRLSLIRNGEEINLYISLSMAPYGENGIPETFLNIAKKQTSYSLPQSP